MNGVDCKAVCREIDELDRDERPGLTILAHVKSCAQCRTFYTDRSRLRELVAELPAISAPADFDFRLRAKLATAKSSPTSPRMFGFSIPSVALATIALLVVGGLSFRALTGSGSEPTVAVTETSQANETTTAQAPSTSPESVTPSTNIKATDSTAETTALSSQPNAGVKPNTAAVKAENRRRGGRYPVQQFVRRENPLAGTETASMFPLEASEPLRVSVDYATGGSRTISVPTLSFGSQEVVSRVGSPMMKTSARTVW